MATVIDACGRSCPEPVILTKNALASGEPRYEVLVDNPTAVENVTRYAGHAGYGVEIRQEGDLSRLLLAKKSQ